MVALVAGIILLSLPGAAIRWLHRIEPARTVRLTRMALVGGVFLVMSGLMSMVVPTLLEGAGAHHLAAICRRILHDVLSLGHPGGVVALMVLAGTTARMVVAVRRVRAAQDAARLEPWIGRQRRIGDYRLVVIDTPKPLAIAARDQIIVSSSLEQFLDSRELEMLVRHELAHLRGKHHRHLTVAAAIDSAFGWLRPIRSSLAAFRFTLERWADEEAAGPNPTDRNALVTALSVVSTTRAQLGLAGFADVATVPERIRALRTRPQPPRRSMKLGAGVVAGMTGAIWISSAAAIVISLTAWGPCAV
jgi:hypothetical protein